MLCQKIAVVTSENNNCGHIFWIKFYVAIASYVNSCSHFFCSTRHRIFCSFKQPMRFSSLNVLFPQIIVLYMVSMYKILLGIQLFTIYITRLDIHYKVNIISHKSDITSLSQKAYQFHYYKITIYYRTVRTKIMNCIHKSDKKCTTFISIDVLQVHTVYRCNFHNKTSI